MRIGPVEASVPTLVAVGFAAVVLVVLLVGASTTATAFGTHNPGWEGLSEVREQADGAGVETVVVTDAAEYDGIAPNGTLVLVVAPDDTTVAERARLRTVAEAGATVVVASRDPDVANPLLSSLGTDVRVDGAVLRDEREHDPAPAFPLVTDAADHPYVRGAEGLALNHGTALAVEGAGPEPLDDDVAARGDHVSIWAGHDAWGGDGPVPLANTSGYAYADRDGDGALGSHELLAERAVVAREPVGNGEVVAVSDPSAFINAMQQREGNRALAAGLLGEHDRVVLDGGDDGVPPLVALLHAVRGTPALTALAGLGLLGAVLEWDRSPLRRRWRALRGDGSSDSRGGPDDRSGGPDGRRGGPGDGAGGRSAVAPDRDALAAYVRDRYPELDDRQRERVLGGIMSVGPEGTEHDRGD